MEPEEETHSLSSYELLNLAENHLRLRNYSLSSQYALESLHSTADANASYDGGRTLRNRAQQIVAVSDVLSASSETLGSPFDNWYSVLGVDTFCSDINLIKSKFKSLLLLLGPVRSTSPAAEEAMGSAWKAWNVLGNPDKKSELDAQLNAGLARASRGAGESGTFWTVCPYCYFMYEYARVFEGYCLRCQNASCRRVFQGVSTRSPPPVGSNQDGFFSCFGYFPLGISHLEDARNGTKVASWSPFVGMFGLPEGTTTSKRKGLDDNTGFVDISDDSEVSEDPVHNVDLQTGRGMIPGNGIIEVPGVGSHVRYGPDVNGKMLMQTGSKMLMQTGKVFQMNKSGNLSDAMGNGGVDIEDNFDQYEQEYGFVSEGCTIAGYECNFEADMQFVEKDGEIFLEMPSGDED